MEAMADMGLEQEDMGLEQEDTGRRQLVDMVSLAMGMIGKDLKTPEAAYYLSVSSLGVLELVVGVWVGQKLGSAGVISGNLIRMRVASMRYLHGNRLQKNDFCINILR